jgi:hypothetical protein
MKSTFQLLKAASMVSVYKIMFGLDPFESLASEDIVSFGLEAFLISVNGLPQKRVPLNIESFNFRGHSFDQCEGGDFWNITDDEYLYLISHSKTVD